MTKVELGQSRSSRSRTRFGPRRQCEIVLILIRRQVCFLFIVDGAFNGNAIQYSFNARELHLTQPQLDYKLQLECVMRQQSQHSCLS